MGCCSNRESMVGHIIFKPLNIKIENCGVKDLDNIFVEMRECLEKTEGTRQKLAEKFKTMLIETGVCVLKNPSVERCITSFMVNVLIEINKLSEHKLEDFNRFQFHSIIKFESTHPFIHFDPEKLKEINSLFKIDLDNNESVFKMKSSIFEFLSSVNLLKDFFTEIENTVIVLFQSAKKIYGVLKQKYYEDEKDKITIGQIHDYLLIAKKNFFHLTEVSEFINLMASLLAEISSSIFTIGNTLMGPREVLKWRKVAVDAVQKKIFDPKQVVFIYSKEKKCKTVEDWKNNICYSKEADTEMLTF